MPPRDGTRQGTGEPCIPAWGGVAPCQGNFPVRWGAFMGTIKHVVLMANNHPNSLNGFALMGSRFCNRNHKVSNFLQSKYQIDQQNNKLFKFSSIKSHIVGVLHAFVIQSCMSGLGVARPVLGSMASVRQGKLWHHPSALPSQFKPGAQMRDWIRINSMLSEVFNVSASVATMLQRPKWHQNN